MSDTCLAYSIDHAKSAVEWVNDCCSMSSGQFFSNIMARTNCISL